MGREMGGRFKREGTYVYLWLIHVDIWRKTTKLCKAIILQLKDIRQRILSQIGFDHEQFVLDYPLLLY